MTRSSKLQPLVISMKCLQIQPTTSRGNLAKKKYVWEYTSNHQIFKRNILPNLNRVSKWCSHNVHTSHLFPEFNYIHLISYIFHKRVVSLQTLVDPTLSSNTNNDYHVYVGYATISQSSQVVYFVIDFPTLSFSDVTNLETEIFLRFFIHDFTH